MSKNQTIQHKRSTVSGNKPTTAQVEKGEIAINLADRALYTQTAGGTIIELASDIFVGTSFVGTPVSGDLWYNPTDGMMKSWDGTKWVTSTLSGKSVLPANTTASVAFSSGAGTSASPYIFSVTANAGDIKAVNKITITNLAPGQYVPIVDLSAATNGGRFSVTNNFADTTGTLVFIIMFTDTPTSANGVTHTSSFKIGTGTVYINSAVSISSPFPQTINAPTDTNSTSTSWTAAADTITATGSLLVSTNNSTFSTGPLAITTGATLYTKWAGAAGSGTGIDGTHGSVVTGGLTSSSGATSSASLTISKNPTAVTFTAQTGIGLSTATTSNTVTIAGVNSYVYLTSSNTMLASVAGGTFGTVPASGTTLYAVNGQTLAVRQTSSATSATTTTVTINLNSTTASFAVTTTTVGTINTPTISSPANSATGISKTLTVTSSAFATTGPAGTHLSTDWTIATDSGFTAGLISLPASTTSLTSWAPSGLSNSTLYYVRVRYNSSTSITSSWSTTVSFTTAAPLGVNWTNRNTQTGLQSSTWSTTTENRKMIWTGTQFLTSGGVFSQYGATSPDGITWTDRPGLTTAISAGAAVAIVWNGSIFCVIASTGKCATSSDGITWTAGNNTLKTAVSSNTPMAVVWTGTKFITVGPFATSATSTDGITWSATGTNIASTGWGGTTQPMSLVWTGSQLCMVGFEGKAATSPDGVTWTYQSGLASVWGSELVNKVLWVSGKFWVAGLNGKIASSPDAVTWTMHDHLRNSTAWGTTLIQEMLWDGTQFYVVGGNAAFATSPDGITWTYQSGLSTALGTANLTRTLATDGTKLVVGGDATTFATSP